MKENWKTPSIIVGILGLVIAVLAFGRDVTNFSMGQDQPPSSSSARAGEATVQDPMTSSSSAQPTSTSTRPPAAGASPPVQWGPGTLRLDAVELDSVPPESGSGGASDIAFERGDGGRPQVLGVLSHKIAKWTESGVPGARECESFVATQGIDTFGGRVPISVGSVICVGTDGGIARLTVKSIAAVGDGDYATVEAIVWTA